MYSVVPTYKTNFGQTMILVYPPQVIYKKCGGLTSLADQLDIHWYLYIVSVLGNCDKLKGLVDKVIADKHEFTVFT